MDVTGNVDNSFNDNFHEIIDISKDEFVDYLISEIDTSEFEEKYSGDYEIDGDSITLEDVDGEDWVLDYEDGDLTGELDLSDLGMDDDVKITFERVEEE